MGWIQISFSVSKVGGQFLMMLLRWGSLVSQEQHFGGQATAGRGKDLTHSSADQSVLVEQIKAFWSNISRLIILQNKTSACGAWFSPLPSHAAVWNVPWNLVAGVGESSSLKNRIAGHPNHFVLQLPSICKGECSNRLPVDGFEGNSLTHDEFNWRAYEESFHGSNISPRCLRTGEFFSHWTENGNFYHCWGSGYQIFLHGLSYEQPTDPYRNEYLLFVIASLASSLFLFYTLSYFLF